MLETPKLFHCKRLVEVGRLGAFRWIRFARDVSPHFTPDRENETPLPEMSSASELQSRGKQAGGVLQEAC